MTRFYYYVISILVVPMVCWLSISCSAPPSRLFAPAILTQQGMNALETDRGGSVWLGMSYGDIVSVLGDPDQVTLVSAEMPYEGKSIAYIRDDIHYTFQFEKSVLTSWGYSRPVVLSSGEPVTSEHTDTNPFLDFCVNEVQYIVIASAHIPDISVMREDVKPPIPYAVIHERKQITDIYQFAQRLEKHSAVLLGSPSISLDFFNNDGELLAGFCVFDDAKTMTVYDGCGFPDKTFQAQDAEVRRYLDIWNRKRQRGQSESTD